MSADPLALCAGPVALRAGHVALCAGYVAPRGGECTRQVDAESLQHEPCGKSWRLIGMPVRAKGVNNREDGGNAIHLVTSIRVAYEIHPASNIHLTSIRVAYEIHPASI